MEEVGFREKNENNLFINYCQVSLLPICSKVFERLINFVCEFLSDNNSLSRYQLGLMPGDSSINQLVSITLDLFYSFGTNDSLEAREVFLEVSEAFDKV